MLNFIRPNQGSIIPQQILPGTNLFQPNQGQNGMGQIPAIPFLPGSGQSMLPSLPSTAPTGEMNQLPFQNVMPWLTQLLTQIQDIMTAISSVFGGQTPITGQDQLVPLVNSQQAAMPSLNVTNDTAA